MSGKKRNAEDDLRRLVDTFVEEVMASPESEILETAMGQQANPAAEAARIRSMLKETATTHGKAKLVAAKAKAAAMASGEAPKSNPSPMSLADKRALLARLCAKHPHLTLAARQGDAPPSEAEIDSLLADLAELGVTEATKKE